MEYNIRNNTDLLALTSKLLEPFILQMKQISNGDTFDIENNNQITRYQFKNEQNIISVNRISIYYHNTNTNINTNINYIIFSILYMDSIKYFLQNNGYMHNDYSNVYINKNDCLVVNTIDSSYYIFDNDNINLMKNRSEIRLISNKREIIK